MAKIEIEVDEAVEKEIAKKDRKIKKLEQELEAVVSALDKMKARYAALQELRDKIVDTAEMIDPYYGADE